MARGQAEAINPVIWTNGSTDVHAFINPKHTMVYLHKQRDKLETGGDIILDIGELRSIIRCIDKRNHEAWVAEYGGFVPRDEDFLG